MNDVTFEIVPLLDLKLSTANARYGRIVPTEDLEISIPAAGRVVTPLLCYREGADVMVWDGGRRMLACQNLAGDKKRSLPASLKAGLPCMVYASREGAERDSLVTFVREQMSPADEFLAYRRLAGAGLSITEIATACNVRTPRVQQLLRLVALAPEVLADFQAGKFPLDVAEAFTLTDSHDRQREILKAFNPKKDNAWGVRQQMRKGAVDADDRWARFVGKDAYAVAGGAFLTDLFSNRNGEDFADRELLGRLAKDKLDALVKKTEAEGWQWVTTELGRDYQWDKAFDRLPGNKKTFGLEDKALAGVSIYIAYNGQPDVERGLVKKVKGAPKLGAVGHPAPKIDQALFGYGHGGHERLSQVATAATQVAVAANPEAAYDALVSALAWTAFRENGRAIFADGSSGTRQATYDSSAMSLRDAERGVGFLRLSEVAGVEAVLERAKVWSAALPHERATFCDCVAALPPGQKADLLALAFAWSLNGVEGRFDYLRKPVRWAHLGWIGRRAGVDINAAWTPDAEFLKKGSKETLLIGVEAMGGAEGMGSAKKGELVAYTAKLAATKRWVPKLLSDLFAKPASAPKAKATKRDQFAADIAKVAAEAAAPDLDANPEAPAV